MSGAPEPVAWLLRESTVENGPLTAENSRIKCGEMFMSEATAKTAATRKSGRWRTCVPVPVYAEPLPAAAPAVEWRCFHCCHVFTNLAQAAAHFGTREDQTPACQLKASEGGLVRALREAEDECERVHTQLHAESADGLRALQNNLGRHRTALVAMEETGYERGLRDHQLTVEALRALIAMVDQMDKPASSGGGVMPIDKATIMHTAREAAK